ncbi:alpha-galactosidase [Actinophytocola sp. KF-1]
MKVTLNAKRAVVSVAHDGVLWFQLRLLSSLDTLHGPDETLGLTTTEDDNRITVRATSSRWEERVTVLEKHPDRLEITTTVRGRGDLLTAHLLGGHRPPAGFLPSGSALDTVFSPNPDHPRRVLRPAVEPAVIAVTGDGAEPGVGRWLFCPAPWCYAVARDGRWAAMGLAAPIAEQTFTSFHYAAGTDGFTLRLDYEGHTRVDGEFTTPTLVIQFGHDTPQAAIRAHSDLLRERAIAPPVPAQVHRHWLEPIFCGWGAQSALPGTTQDESTQENYDRFLTHLARHDVVPGTVVVDDKWAAHYATSRADEHKWPDLRGWIAKQHAEDRRVLLWWKAWDHDGAPPEACVTLPDGTPVALDPEHPLGEKTVVDAVTHMLGDLDADGLKVDFLAKTPSGTALRHAGRRWGAALLHHLLRLVYDTAKSVKPGALIVTHTPNPAFADVTDMIRLNDIRMLDAIDPDGPVVPHMRYRASVVTAALPGMPVDSDGWCLPDRAEWRAYLDIQAELGVPALYYADRIDLSGEALTGEDLAEVARVWGTYRHTLDGGRTSS